MRYYDVFIIRCMTLEKKFSGRIQADSLEHAVLNARVDLKLKLKPNEFLGVQRKK